MNEHIHINAVVPNVHYVADGVQTAFVYPFVVLKSADLQVWQDGTLVSGGFTVSGAGISGGGSVLFAVPPAAGTRITLRRHMVLERVSDFQADGIIRAKTLNDELDYQVAAVQQVAEGVSRCLQRPFISSSTADLTLPEPLAGRGLKWNADGSGVTNTSFDPDVLGGAMQSAVSAQHSAVANAAAAAEAAAAAQTYALAAQSAAVSNLYAVVVDVVADRQLAEGDNGTMFRVDASAGPVVLTLPSAMSLVADWRVGIVRLDAGNNAVIVRVAEGSGDDIEGDETLAIVQQFDTATLFANAGVNGWTAIVNPDDQTLARLNAPQTWSAAQGYAFAPLAYAASVTWDVRAMPAAVLTMTGNPEITATNIEDGRVYQLRLTHSGAARVPIFGSAFAWGDDGSATFSTTAGKTDYLVFVGYGSTALHFMGAKTGY